MGAEQLAAEGQLALAGLDVEEGRPEKAEPQLRAAIADFEKEKSDPDASGGYTLLSRALRMQGKMDEARQAAERGAELARTSSDPSLQLPAEIEQAQTEAASGARLQAAKRLNQIIASTRRLGYYNIECQARLALGELEMQWNASSGHRDLADLANETRSRGLMLVARDAQSALAKSAVVAQNGTRR
jgi:ATP/maltotriose-dependent transcriptional regulator MalT